MPFFRQNVARNLGPLVILIFVCSFASLSGEDASPVSSRDSVWDNDLGRCSKLVLDIEGAWTHRGAWSVDEKKLLLPDVFAGSIRVVSPSDAALSSWTRPGEGLLEANKPYDIVSIEGKYVLWEGAAHLIWLNQYLEPFEGIELAREDWKGDFGVGAVRSWSLVDGGENLVAYGDLLDEDESWEDGFFSVDLVGRTIRKFDVRTVDIQAKLYFTSIYEYSARLDDEVFFLVAEANGKILSLKNDEHRFLKAFPTRFQEVPPRVDPQKSAIANIRETYSAIEKTSMPTGLYAGQNELFIMTREPHDEKDGTRWSLFPLDPEKDEIGEEITLPTTAAHVFLVPGSKYWAVVEKGSVEVGGGQTLESVLLLPTEWIEGETSPLHDGGEVLCEKRRAH